MSLTQTIYADNSPTELIASTMGISKPFVTITVKAPVGQKTEAFAQLTQVYLMVKQQLLESAEAEDERTNQT
jgi:hypothetical protein